MFKILALFASLSIAYVGVPFHIVGYKSKIVNKQEKIEVSADSSDGLSGLGFEDLQNARISVKLENGKSLEFQYQKALFKSDEIIFSGKGSFQFIGRNKKVFTILNQGEKDVAYLDVKKMVFKTTSATVIIGKKRFSNRSIQVDLKEGAMRLFDNGPSTEIKF